MSAINDPPGERVIKFLRTTRDTTSGFRLSDSFEELLKRLSSSVGFFSVVLDRVPDIVPHENGKLVMKAMLHTLTPRILFPNKPDLGGDSWLIREYAGIYVAGDEANVSIGLGYIPEFYIDFGIPGIIALSFIFGLFLGCIYKLFILISPSYDLYFSVIAIIFLNNFVRFEGEIAKIIGGIVMNSLVFAAILYFRGLWIHNKLTLDRSGQRRFQ